ncbi:TRAP transporter small permease [uncultured Polaribacter sp.]|uniref:TRAP transporter small permease n=1 Tax=uncultured Polaribacter sp. TaxID=174711 RepID=UPI00260F463A|nr:TRAP transporter small permease [uncultured Polaribacter sp.]
MRAKIDNILERSVLFVLTLMLLSVIWQVFSRFILRNPSTITDEISSFSLIWLGLLGAAYATGKHLHLAIDLIPEKVIAKKQNLYDGIVYISTFVFAFTVMVIGGIRLCQLSFQFGQTSATLEIPLGFIYLVVPLAGLLICYYSLDTLLDKRKLNKS